MLNCRRKRAFLILVSCAGFLRKKVSVFSLAEKTAPRSFLRKTRNLRANRARRATGRRRTAGWRLRRSLRHVCKQLRKNFLRVAARVAESNCATAGVCAAAATLLPGTDGERARVGLRRAGWELFCALGLVLWETAAGSKLWGSFLGTMFLWDFTLKLAVVVATVLITKM